MGKKNAKSTATKVAVLSPEEFKKLTPEEQVEYVTKLQSHNESLVNQSAELLVKIADAKKGKPGKGKDPLPSIEVDEDEENDIEGGEYEFTSPTFTHGGKVIKVADLMADAEGKDNKKSEAALTVIAALVKRKSGLLRKKED